MKRRILTILLLAVLFLITAANPTTVHAEGTKGASAHFTGPDAMPSPPTVEKDHRAEILKLYLEQYNSPMADHADTLVKEADANNLDWRMVAAISGVESGFGNQIPGYSYNAWGFGVYGNNVRRFASWDDGITTVTTALRQEYMNQRGATDVYGIGATYAASPTWAYRVQGYMDDIDQFSKRFDNPTLSISL